MGELSTNYVERFVFIEEPVLTTVSLFKYASCS